MNIKFYLIVIIVFISRFSFAAENSIQKVDIGGGVNSNASYSVTPVSDIFFRVGYQSKYFFSENYLRFKLTLIDYTKENSNDVVTGKLSFTDKNSNIFPSWKHEFGIIQQKYMSSNRQLLTDTGYDFIGLFTEFGKKIYISSGLDYLPEYEFEIKSYSSAPTRSDQLYNIVQGLETEIFKGSLFYVSFGLLYNDSSNIEFKKYVYDISLDFDLNISTKIDLNIGFQRRQTEFLNRQINLVQNEQLVYTESYLDLDYEIQYDTNIIASITNGNQASRSNTDSFSFTEISTKLVIAF